MYLYYGDTALITETRLKKLGKFLSTYVNRLQAVANTENYEEAECSINLPYDETLVKTVLKLKEKKTNSKLKYIVDIGIGGSSLGTKAVYDALYGYFDILEPRRFPKMIFVDTNDPMHIAHIQKFLKTIKNPDEILINAISKSGNTTETMANLEMLSGYVKNFKSRTVITTNRSSRLWRIAENENIDRLAIPEKVGGRYSVFSAVGLFPLACANINIVNLLEGAMATRQAGLRNNVLENPSAISAIIAYIHYKGGKNINNTFFFHPELESVGKWYRQLMGESLGKKHIGITPTVAIGSTDLHSMGQLYLGGPRDKYFTFVKGGHSDYDVRVPQKLPIPSAIKEIKGKSADAIVDAIYEGVKKAYVKRKLPFSEIVLEKVNEHALGQFLQFKMIEMMYLGKLLGVNAFNQPNVESYKTETKKILAA